MIGERQRASPSWAPGVDARVPGYHGARWSQVNLERLWSARVGGSAPEGPRVRGFVRKSGKWAGVRISPTEGRLFCSQSLKVYCPTAKRAIFRRFFVPVHGLSRRFFEENEGSCSCELGPLL